MQVMQRYKHYSLLLTANMQQLLDDPQTLPFKKGKHISLKILKKEIDRRIIKIRRMLGDHQTPKNYTAKQKSIACQTNLPLVFPIPQNTNELPLTSNSSIVNSAEENQEKKAQSKRCSLPVSKSKHKKQQTMDCSNDKNKIKLSQYLSGVKSKDDYQIGISQPANGYNDELQDQKMFVQTTTLDSNIFSAHDLQNFTERPSNLIRHTLALDNSDQEDDDSLNSDEESSLINKRLSNIGLKSKSLRKIKFTDRTAPESENRIIFGQDCRERMEKMVSGLITKKRRELRDTKIRENIIKKIDEKYGDHVSF